jgi:iron complex outermembrane recepter protein
MQASAGHSRTLRAAIRDAIAPVRTILPVAMIACGLPAAALADTAGEVQTTDAAAAPAAAAETGALQEVTVTATRREESLSKVPISITALTSADMEAKGIKDIEDIARFTPGMSVDTSGTNSISIRGISSSGGAGTTGIYIDDTPIQMRGLAFNPDEAVPKMFDIDRVEVLRGPQGTLFGAGSEGGTVRYITVQPSLTKTTEDARAEVDYTQGGAPSYEIGAAVGGPIIDGKFGVRLTLWYRRDGGWIDADSTGDSASDSVTNPTVTEKNANYQSNYVARLAGLWAVSETWTVTPSIFLQKREQHNSNDFWACDSYRGGFSNSQCETGSGVVGPNSSNDYNNGDPTLRSLPDTFYLPALKVDGDLGFAHFISNSSLYHRDDLSAYEGTEYNAGFYQIFIPGASDINGNTIQPLVPLPLLDGNGFHMPAGLDYLSPNSINNGQQNLNQEFRLVSSDPNAKLVWATGLFYSYARQIYLEQIHDPMLNDLTETVFGEPYTNIFYYAGTDPTCNGLGNCPVPYVAAYPNDAYFLSTHAVDKQYAWYGEATYSFTDQLKATVGLRESHMFASIDSTTGGPQLYAPTTSDYHSTTENAFTPKVNLAYQITDKDMVYATYAKGFRPGGGDNPLPAAACDFPAGYQTPTTYRSDSLNSFEVGSKDNFGGDLKVSGSVYYIKWNNIQQNVEVPVCEITYITNLGEAVAKGADLQVEWAVTHDLSAELASGYTDARLTKTVFAPSYPGAAPLQLASAGDAVIGESGVPNAPFTAAVGLEYHFSVAQHDSFARLDWEYEAHSKWLPPTQNPADAGQYDPDDFTLPSTSFVSFRSGMQLGDLSIEPFIDNLTDAHPLTNYAWSVINPGYTRLLQGFTYRPRTFGVTFTYHH